MAKVLKLKAERFWGLIRMFVKVTREKLVGGEERFDHRPPPPPILNRVNIQLHCFHDSSLQACSRVTYIYVITNFGVTVNLLCSKSKFSPMKEITIPRLKFVACVLLTKLLQAILKRL